MVDIIAAFLMAIFQGVIEWLPISSEGQLSLFFVNLYGMDELEAVTLALLLHLGTMLSVLWVFRSDFREMVDIKAKITEVTIITTLGTAVTAIPIVLVFKTYWTPLTDSFPIPPDILFTLFVGILLILTGLILINQPEQGTRELNSITQREAFLLGMAQGIAALPGISRSGMTITILLIIGLTQRDALRVSFIVSVPAVLGATVLEFFLSGFTIYVDALRIGDIIFPYILLILTILMTAIVGVFTMRSLLQLKSIPYDKFCISFGIGTILLAILLFIIQVVI
ncbi:MAG: undecaprenyl-diphosphate phosphatase [Candidatus Heimdallarchaeota archaeon]|nr:MAG: undecaprenyl-diphosphate phosphatase [Candidatus Heimdallarchaeota archaeon]